MNIELLKTFLEVSRTRHFSRAAELLYLTQSAVSFRIKQLENKLGVNLFIRHRNNIDLTPAGKRLLPYATNLISTWNLTKKEVVYAANNIHPNLSIGSSASLWEAYLTPWLKSIYHVQPDIYLDIQIAQRTLLMKQLYEHQLDILISTEIPKVGNFISKQIGNISLKLFKSYKNKNFNNKSNYIQLEWGTDFYRDEDYLTKNKMSPILITSSAHLTRYLLHTINTCAFLPKKWELIYYDLMAIANAPVINCSLYAIWLQNNDFHTNIKKLIELTNNIIF
ncbi:MAG: HTH-type transcriptional regulator HdfR [Candidatus Dasytiphilus stammeri]